MSKITAKIKEILGKPVFQLKLFGILHILDITKTNAVHTNVYVFYVPLLRINKSKTEFGISILVFTWIYKFFLAIFGKFTIVHNKSFSRWNYGKQSLIEIMHDEKCRGLKIFGKNFYSVTVIEPFKFPAVMVKE